VKSVGKSDSVKGLMENAASVEIREKRGFPPPLGKVSPKSGETFPHFPQALLGSLSCRSFGKTGKAARRKATEGDGQE
jgi:hypothetical protein